MESPDKGAAGGGGGGGGGGLPGLPMFGQNFSTHFLRKDFVCVYVCV